MMGYIFQWYYDYGSFFRLILYVLMFVAFVVGVLKGRQQKVSYKKYFYVSIFLFCLNFTMPLVCKYYYAISFKEKMGDIFNGDNFEVVCSSGNRIPGVTFKSLTTSWYFSKKSGSSPVWFGEIYFLSDQPVDALVAQDSREKDVFWVKSAEHPKMSTLFFLRLNNLEFMEKCVSGLL